jgi:hypothetical protein
MSADHAGAAKRILGAEELSGLGHERVQAAATLALAHATLALVEQQRIANLIALRNSDDPALQAIGAVGLHDGQGKMRRIRYDIQKGLGL